MLKPLIQAIFSNEKFKHKLTLCFICLVYLLPLHAAQPPTATPNQLPEALTLPSDSTPLETNTPEYVVIKPSNQATFSSETAASVETINVKEGSKFLKDDILLKLDCRLQEAELKKSLAQQESAKMAKAAAVKLKSYGSISEYELIKAKTDEQVSNAEVDKLHAIVDKCVIKAPFSGSVAELMVHEHESVRPGDPMLKIVSTENLEFEIQIPSAWLEWLHVGSVFTVKLNETNKVISAKITKINPQIEPISQSVKIVGTVQSPDNTLLPGMSGQAQFVDNPENKTDAGKTHAT